MAWNYTDGNFYCQDIGWYLIYIDVQFEIQLSIRMPFIYEYMNLFITVC